MINVIEMNDTTMLGTYHLDGDIPVEPEVVLTNCTDTSMVGQLVSAFSSSPDIRFFLIEHADENAIDLNADFHFLKDSGNWVLANHNTMMKVLFDDADFNPAGTEGTFSITQDMDGTWMISTGEELAQAGHLPPSEQLLVDMAENDIFGPDADTAQTGIDHETFFIDPSVLPQGEHEILVSNFTLGQDTLELPAGMSIKDVIVDSEHDLTEVVITQDNGLAEDDIVVKLLGVSQPAMPGQEYGLETDANGDDLISHLISAGIHTD